MPTKTPVQERVDLWPTLCSCHGESDEGEKWGLSDFAPPWFYSQLWPLHDVFQKDKRVSIESK